jgi:Putative peptidoglycan binding domain
VADDPVFVEKFVRIVGGEHRKGHFPDIWVPHKPQKPCLLSPDAVDVVAISTASGAPDVHTISDLQQALKMLGYRITVASDYGPETRQVVTSFQMHAGILADGIAGSQTEAKLLTELSRSGRRIVMATACGAEITSEVMPGPTPVVMSTGALPTSGYLRLPRARGGIGRRRARGSA